VQAVILAGGLGTRMRPATLTTPKSLLPVAGRPFLHWQLKRIAECGYDDVVVLAGYLGEQVEAFVGDGSQWGVRARVIQDGPTRLGTGGALHDAMYALDDHFLVTYGDSYLPFPFNYETPHLILRAYSDCDAVMALYENAGRWQKSNAATDGEWVLNYDKEADGDEFRFIDYGVIAMCRKVLMDFPMRSLSTIQSKLAELHRMRALVVRLPFYEIGSPDGLRDLEAYFSP